MANETNPNEPTPNEALEAEVIRATRPKIVQYEDENGTRHEVKILPLPADMIDKGSREISELIRPIIHEFVQISLKASSINRSEAGVESQETAPVSSNELNTIFKDFLDPAKLAKTLSKIPSLAKLFIEMGTNISYDEIKGDGFVVIEFIVQIFMHNIGPRLQRFLSQDYSRMKEILLGQAGLEQKPVL